MGQGQPEPLEVVILGTFGPPTEAEQALLKVREVDELSKQSEKLGMSVFEANRAAYVLPERFGGPMRAGVARSFVKAFGERGLNAEFTPDQLSQGERDRLQEWFGQADMPNEKLRQQAMKGDGLRARMYASITLEVTSGDKSFQIVIDPATLPRDGALHRPKLTAGNGETKSALPPRVVRDVPAQQNKQLVLTFSRPFSDQRILEYSTYYNQVALANVKAAKAEYEKLIDKMLAELLSGTGLDKLTGEGQDMSKLPKELRDQIGEFAKRNASEFGLGSGDLSGWLSNATVSVNSKRSGFFLGATLYERGTGTPLGMTRVGWNVGLIGDKMGY